MKSFSVLLSVVLGLAGTVQAQVATDANAKQLDQVRTLFQTYQDANEKAQEQMKPLQAEFRAAERGSDAQKKLSAQLGALRATTMAPQKAFMEAFARCNWQKLDAQADAKLLQEALPTVARDGDKPQQALEACNFYLQHFGDARGAASIRSSALPNALLATGNADEAVKVLTAAIEEAKGPAKANTMLTLGDIQAAKGDTEAAAKLYDEAAGIADQNTMRYVTLRKELIGRPAPDIASKEWIGAEASSLGAKKGKVVLVDFWATWCGPCRHVMPALNEMYRKHHADGLEVMGVTRFYDYGYLPANKEQMQSGGKSIAKGSISEADFAAHVTAFKQNTGIEYPFVIGDKSNFEAYHVSGIPTLAVVDRDGKIALITVGSGSEALLKFAVEKLLAKK